MGSSDRPLAADLIVEQERLARDQEADEYGSRRARDAYHRTVEDACVMAAISKPPPEAVLDAGCGTGQHVERLLQLADRVIAVDHSAVSVELAAARVPESETGRVTFHAADLRALPIADGAVDAVVSVEVLQHIPTAEARLEALRELRRVLRPGGRLALAVYRWRGHIRREREGYFPNGIYRYAFTARELRRAVTDAGFEDVRVGGTVFAPSLGERLGVGVGLQRRLVHNPIARPLAHYLLATAVSP